MRTDGDGVLVDSDGARGRAGEVRPAAGEITLAPDMPRRTVVLLNTGHRDVWVSSHFPLDQVNPAVEIRFGDEAENRVRSRDRFCRPGLRERRRGGPPAAGCRLDLPAGEALRLRPGEERTATAVVTAGSAAAR